MDYDYDKPGNIPVIAASLRERLLRTSPAPVDPEPDEPEPGPVDPAPAPAPLPAGVPFPALRMTRADASPPVVVIAGDNMLQDAGRASFDLLGTMKVADPAGEYTLGGADPRNRFKFYLIGTPTGANLQVSTVTDGAEKLVGSPKVRRIAIGEQLRFRIRTIDGKAYLAVFFGGEEVWSGGPYAAYAGGTKFAWRNDARPVANDVQIADAVDPLRCDHADIVSTNDLRAIIPISYSTLASDPEPAGIEVQQYYLDGTIAVPWEDAAIISYDGPGKCRIGAPTPYPGKRGKLVAIEVRQKAVPTVTTRVKLYYPKPMKIGQNLSNLFSASRPLRVWTNMLKQAQWVLITDNYRVLAPNEPGHTDALGNPISANGGDKWCWYPLPDERNVDVLHTLRWKGGPIKIEHYLRDNALGWLGASQIVQVDANTLQWRNRGDRRVARGNAQAARFRLMSIDPANPPTEMQLFTEFDDPTQTFTAPFVRSLKQLPGWLRFMDNIGVNGAVSQEGRLAWSKRARIDLICAGGLAYEHIVEMANISGRQVKLNLLPNFAYSAEATDHFDRMVDLFLFGIGSAVPSTGLARALAIEALNEAWNDGLNRGGDCFAYLRIKGQQSGRSPAEERVWCVNWLYRRLQTRYANDNDKLDLKFGYQMGASDPGFMAAMPDWAELRPRITGGLIAPYVPGDPNAGLAPGQQPPALDPASVSAWFIERLHNALIPGLRATVHAIAEQGLEVEVYEVNMAMKAILDMSMEQIWAFYGSAGCYDFWYNHFIPWLSRLVGGNQCLYSDTGVVSGPNAEMWTTMPLPNSEFNQPWDACVNWTEANRIAA
ncbi:hypothetical protein [Sphingomonas sp. CFBP 8760]|uniref:hypothetical protein n=1 Tax=Sphingomonas sp. CFBP 8760 TaxID=2775282 RepID=UPI001A91F6B9|nr:hypothetical protein [Sphingomonas sp. CFBP 8760]